MATDQNSIIDLWTLVKGSPSIDPDDLLRAVEEEFRTGSADYRTRLLIHESLLVLCNKWGEERLTDRLAEDIRDKAKILLKTDPGEIGFPTLGSA